MRNIGQFNAQEQADRFSHILRAENINIDLETEADGAISVWIIDEDQIDRAETLFERYQSDPQNEAFCDAAVKGERLSQQDKVKAKKQAITGKVEETRYKISGVPVLTYSMIAICVIIYLLHGTEQGEKLYSDLMISTWQPQIPSAWFAALKGVRSGQFWRLVTPVFLHFSLLHILFNMIWLLDLGRSIELRKGSLFFALFVIIVAIPSNLAQFAFTGPAFGGMSGVVYGMLGYVYMKSTFSPREGFILHKNTMIFMMIWLLLGFLSATGVRTANLVHIVGLLIGTAWGYVTSVRPFSRDA